MKIGTTKERLSRAVLLTERIVGKKESLPVLSCILIEVGKECILRATNLEAGIEVRIPVEIDEVGMVAVNAHVLAQTIRSVSAEKITLRNEDSNLLIESRGTKTLIKAVPHNEFPPLSPMGGSRGISVSRDLLMRGIQSVAYAASPSMIRPELGSVYVSMNSSGMTTVATDSFRLAEKSIRSTTIKNEQDLLIPLKHALELTHVLESIDSEMVEMHLNDSELIVTGNGLQIGQVRYISRVIDGQFPNYKEIIPKQFTTEATVLKNDFAEMLRKARVFSGNDQHVGLHLYPKRKIFSATAQSPDVGEMSDSIDAAISGDDLDINFHIGYLSDCFSSIASDSITLNFSGPGRPVVIRGVSDASFTYLVMPLNR
ncbi:MAG TPA: DNA polymerase III subunit beta [Candidatus Paceibacterota bacterium]|nr:DNA polymerase III subunit beta [Candidatus Paceibacterota bacterium]